jgi:hypothetical protein
VVVAVIGTILRAFGLAASCAELGGEHDTEAAASAAYAAMPAHKPTARRITRTAAPPHRGELSFRQLKVNPSPTWRGRVPVRREPFRRQTLRLY